MKIALTSLSNEISYYDMLFILYTLERPASTLPRFVSLVSQGWPRKKKICSNHSFVFISHYVTLPFSAPLYEVIRGFAACLCVFRLSTKNSTIVLLNINRFMHSPKTFLPRTYSLCTQHILHPITRQKTRQSPSTTWFSWEDFILFIHLFI